jgi:hypothetical protein
MEVPSGLLEKVLKRIHREERLLIFRRIILLSVIFTMSLVGLFPAFNMLLSDFQQSGFLQFSSLAFSDFSIVTTYWKSFVMTLLQTLPAISLALFLTVLLTFLQSIKSLIKYERRYISIKNI